MRNSGGYRRNSCNKAVSAARILSFANVLGKTAMGEFSIAADTSELGHNGDLSDSITSGGARLTGEKCKGGSHLRDVEPCAPGPRYKEERTYCQGHHPRTHSCPFVLLIVFHVLLPLFSPFDLLYLTMPPRPRRVRANMPHNQKR
jgi:hypothetical protein